MYNRPLMFYAERCRGPEILIVSVYIVLTQCMVNIRFHLSWSNVIYFSKFQNINYVFSQQKELRTCEASVG